MTGPILQANGARANSAGAATLTPAKPTVAGQNGKLYAVLQTKNNAVHSTATSGWAKVNQTNSGASFTASLWEAPEGSAAPVFTWTGSVACAAQVFYFADPAGALDTFGSVTASAGTTSTHTSTAITTTRPNSLAAYFDCAAANTAIATPSGWTEEIDAGSATDAGRTAIGDKAIASSGTSSGAISVTGAAAAWVQWQIEIRSQAAGPLDFSKLEVGAWFTPTIDAASWSQLEAGAWFTPPIDAAAWSQLEAGLWLEPGPFWRFLQDWPNPQIPRRAVQLRTWLNPTAINLIGQDALPAARGLAPATRRRERRSPPAFAAGLNLNLLSAAPVAPDERSLAIIW